MTDVLVVGMGPTGLTLAAQAHDHGARVRVVDRRVDPFRPSRALIMHARTLEVLRPLGVTEAVLDRADLAPRVRLRLGRRCVTASLADLPMPDTPYPHLTLLRQADVEAVLREAIERRGLRAEWGTTLVGAWQEADHVRALLRGPAGVEEVRCRFLAGCDGPTSAVREAAAIGWPGGPYREEIVLADLELDAPGLDATANVVVRGGGLLFLFPLGEHATWRLLATRRAAGPATDFGQPGPSVPAAELDRLLFGSGLDARIADVAWSTRIRVQHRLATRFRRGDMFLVGDAAHAYSPATGQGMNAGIQDATNLGWKLAFAIHRADTGALLDSYELERRPAARELLLITHAAFWAEASTGPLPSGLRALAALGAAPLVPVLLNQRRVLAEVVRLISQLRVDYRGSPLSVDDPGYGHPRPRAGDRVPDFPVMVDGHRTRVHELLAGPGVHVLLHRDAAELDPTRLGPLITAHRLSNVPGRGIVVVRPDGYVGLRGMPADPAVLGRWLTLAGAQGGRGP